MEMSLPINLAYIASAILFIYGLKLLGHPATARRGNMLSAIGMLIAISVTLFNQSIIDFKWIAVGILIGSIIGVLAARLVAMTQMPEMVALFNGFGGMASLMVGWATLSEPSLTVFNILTMHPGNRLTCRITGSGDRNSFQISTGDIGLNTF